MTDAVTWLKLEAPLGLDNLKEQRYDLSVGNDPLGYLVVEAHQFTFRWPGEMSTSIEQTVYHDLPLVIFGQALNIDTQKAEAEFILTDSNLVEFELPGDLANPQYRDIINDSSQIAFGRFDVILENGPNPAFMFCFDNDVHELLVTLPQGKSWTTGLVVWLLDHHTKVKSNSDLLDPILEAINSLSSALVH